MTLVVNGRFLGARATGLHRVARGYLSCLQERGVDAEVFAPQAVHDPAVDRHVWAPPGRLGAHLWEQLLLPAAAGPRPVLSLANTGPIRRRAVATVHDLASVMSPEWFHPRMRLYGRISLTAARRAALVLAVSHVVANELVDAGVAESRITVVRPAVDSQFTPAPLDERMAVRRRFGLQDPYVVHVGWADPRKGAAFLVEAHRQLLAERPHLLVLVGESHPNFAPVRLPALSTVRILSGVSDVDLRALLSGAAALAFPSRAEGFGLPPLEAIACGTPAIVADIPVLRESVGDAALRLPVDNVDAWVGGLRAAIDGELPTPSGPTWSWHDAGRILLAALKSVGGA